MSSFNVQQANNGSTAGVNLQCEAFDITRSNSIPRAFDLLSHWIFDQFIDALSVTTIVYSFNVYNSTVDLDSCGYRFASFLTECGN